MSNEQFYYQILKNNFAPKAVAKLMGDARELITMDVYGQNIYNGYCVRMGEDGRSETVSRYEGFPKTAIVLPVVTDG